MTPNKLLEQVKSRFVNLFHKEPEALTNLLCQALGVYQDRAGIVEKIILENDGLTVSIPDSFDGLIACGNKNGSRVKVSVKDGAFDLSNARAYDYPLTLSYFVDLRGVDLDTYELPSETIRLISDYLEVLIQIPNAARDMRVAVAGGFDTSHIPTEPDLRGRLKELELEIEAQLVLPTVSVR